MVNISKIVLFSDQPLLNDSTKLKTILYIWWNERAEDSRAVPGLPKTVMSLDGRSPREERLAEPIFRVHCVSDRGLQNRSLSRSSEPAITTTIYKSWGQIFDAFNSNKIYNSFNFIGQLPIDSHNSEYSTWKQNWYIHLILRQDHVLRSKYLTLRHDNGVIHLILRQNHVLKSKHLTLRQYPVLRQTPTGVPNSEQSRGWGCIRSCDMFSTFKNFKVQKQKCLYYYCKWIYYKTTLRSEPK